MYVRLGILGIIAELFCDIAKTTFKIIFEEVPINIY